MANKKLNPTTRLHNAQKRNFAKGRLKGMIAQLETLAESDVTYSFEEVALFRARKILNELVRHWEPSHPHN